MRKTTRGQAAERLWGNEPVAGNGTSMSLVTPNTRILTYTPCVALQPFVKRFLVVESSADHHDAHLPDTAAVAAFRFRGDCRLENGDQAPRAAITGLWETTRTHVHSADHAVVIATFTATGAGAWVRQPLDAFTNATTDLSAVLARSALIDQLDEQLATAAHHLGRIHLVENFLLRHADPARVDPEMRAAVALIAQAQTTPRIADLAQQLGLSQSALERRFRQVVGLSPRKFVSLVRFRHVLQLRTAGADLTTIAHAAGYYDQPHFIKDFKRFTGQAPQAFFAHPVVE